MKLHFLILILFLGYNQNVFGGINHTDLSNYAPSQQYMQDLIEFSTSDLVKNKITSL